MRRREIGSVAVAASQFQRYLTICKDQAGKPLVADQSPSAELDFHDLPLRHLIDAGEKPSLLPADSLLCMQPTLVRIAARLALVSSEFQFHSPTPYIEGFIALLARLRDKAYVSDIG